MPERPGTATVAEALRWLRPAAARSSSSSTSTSRTRPTSRRAEFAAGAPDAYHGEVAAADAALEPLLRPILEQGTRGRTLVILTSDHGESLGEHGEATHGIFAYEATLRVPLVVYAPVALPAARRARAGPPRGPRPDRARRARDGAARRACRAGACCRCSRAGQRASRPRLLRGAHGLAQPALGAAAGRARRRAQVHRPAAARALRPRRRPRRGAQPRRLAAAGPRAAARAARAAARAATAACSRRRRTPRRSSGCARSATWPQRSRPAPKERYTGEDDPKRLIDLDAKTKRDAARSTARADRGGDRRRARGHRAPAGHGPRPPADRLPRARAGRPARRDRGRAARGRAAAAATRSRAALLAVYLTEAGRAPAAVRFLEPWLERDDDDLDVLNALAMALATLGPPREALDVLARARAAHPTNTQVLVNIGTVYLTDGDLDHARQAFEAALDVDPDVARAHNSLGVIAAREGRMPEAIERWKARRRARPQRLPDALQPRLGALASGAARGGTAVPRGATCARRPPRSRRRHRAGARLAEGAGGRGGTTLTRRAPWLACGLVAGAVLAACRSDRAGPYSSASVVLVSIDTLRADRLPALRLRDGRDAAPRRPAAKECIVFEQAYSHCPLTLPSHASLFTGLLPPHHGVRDNQGFALGVTAADAGHALPGRRASTRARRCRPTCCARPPGSRRASTSTTTRSTRGRCRRGAGRQQRDGAAVGGVAAALDRGAVRPKRFFAFLHLYEPHTPYTPPAAYPGARRPLRRRGRVRGRSRRTSADAAARAGACSTAPSWP